MSMPNTPAVADPSRQFLEFRRKVQQDEVLSGSLRRLLEQLKFSGRLTLVVQNGRVLKAGYEESYFRQRS